MSAETFVLLLVVVTALGFDFTNGFHDTGNAMATSIATGALKPKVAVGLSAVANLVGAFLSVSVAITVTNAVVKTISSAKPATKTSAAVPAHLVHQNLLLAIVFAGLIGGILWNLITWLLSLPSSSSHALFGGLIGSAIASLGWNGVNWAGDGTKLDGVVGKIVLPAIASPVVAAICAAIATYFIYRVTTGVAQKFLNSGFRWGQIGTATLVSLAHGTNDGITITASGTPVGAVKHVWLIILENKSYDATFTGLNNNSYLWKTLPSQGALLKNYYGTGHFSLDNYTSMVSGQGPAPADQNDCPVYADQQGAVVTSNATKDGPTTDRGQMAELGAPYANPVAGGAAEGAHGGTGCVYPASVPTLFNQLDAAGVSWKGYAQDLGNTDATGPTHDVNSCGVPGSPAGVGVTNPGSANATDQYVPKHFPFPWFESLLSNPADCTSAEIANLDSPAGGLVHDLQSEATTPAFSWITPDNCSDAHDAICAGNNLSGAFDASGNPVYAPSGLAAYQPEATTPTNFTGGLYASDLFLKYYIPLIEQSAAFKDGGLIDVTFDEANPPFANSSFNDANNLGGLSGVQTPATASGYAQSDLAGESFNTKHGVVNRPIEPTGPNTPLLTDANGNQVYPGPGDSAFIDRPSSLSGDAVNDPKYVLGGGNLTPGPRTDSTGVGGSIGSDVITDPAITAPDAGRPISGAGIPANACVGPVNDAGPRFDTASSAATVKPASNPGNKAYIGTFEVVDCTSNAVVPLTSAVTSVSFVAETTATDPLFSSTIATPGGGDTGSVLISPLIKPGTVSTIDYNHYSWLATMEDLFKVTSGHQDSTIPGGAGSVSQGLDGQGHLGFAAQPDLRTFGFDVFNNVPGHKNH